MTAAALIKPSKPPRAVPAGADILARAERVCAERGLRLTIWRRLVLKELASASAPLGAYEIAHRLRGTARVSVVTIYRVLDFLIGGRPRAQGGLAEHLLGKACSEAGPVRGDTARLVKLALAIGASSEGAVHSHTRRALSEGISKEALKQVALLAIPTLGLPQAAKALTWIEDVTDPQDALGD